MRDDLDALLSWLVAEGANRNWSSEPEIDTLAAWWSWVRPSTADWNEPVDRAIVRAFRADRVAYAFAAGYQAALRRLVPALPDDRVVSLCITEEKGNHPRAIASRLERRTVGSPDREAGASAETASDGGGWFLTGQKRWATHSPEAMELLVAARAGAHADGRPDIRLVRVRGDAAGLRVEPMHGVSFVPEISHGTVVLDRVAVGDHDLLPGDGYANYVKPFRTIEDLHVVAALSAHLLALGFRFGWPEAVRESSLAMLVSARSLALADPMSAATHLALGGVFREQARILAEIEPCFASVDAATRSRWERDSALLGVAGAARAKRLEVAWRTISATASGAGIPTAGRE